MLFRSVLRDIGIEEKGQRDGDRRASVRGRRVEEARHLRIGVAQIHAQIVAQLRDGRSIVEVWRIFELPIVFAVCFLGFLIAGRYFLFGIELVAELVFVVAIVCVVGCGTDN